MSDTDIQRGADGTISIYFGDERCAGKPNVIETTEGQEFYYGARLYRPLDVDATREFIEGLRARPIRPVSP